MPVPPRSLPAQEIEDFVVEQIKRIGQDPELADQVFAEAVKQQKQQRQRLKREYKRLQKERQQKGEEIKRLVGAIAGSDAPSPSLTKRLAEAELILERLDYRLIEVKESLTAIDNQVVNHTELRVALTDFMPVWEHLSDNERVRILDLVLRQVTYRSEIVNLEVS